MAVLVQSNALKRIKLPVSLYRHAITAKAAFDHVPGISSSCHKTLIQILCGHKNIIIKNR